MKLRVYQEAVGGAYSFQFLDEESGALVLNGPTFADLETCQTALSATIASLRARECFQLTEDDAGVFLRIVDPDGSELAISPRLADRSGFDPLFEKLNTWANSEAEFVIDVEHQEATVASTTTKPPRPIANIDVATLYDLSLVSTSGKSGVELLRNPATNLYCFHINDENHVALLYSRGFKTIGQRSKRLVAVLRHSQVEARYEQQERDGRYFFIIKSSNGQEIARSREFVSSEECTRASSWLRAMAPTYAQQFSAHRKTKTRKTTEEYNLTFAARTGKTGFETFRDDADRLYYFIFFDDQGNALLLSQGYTSARSRDQGVLAVIKSAGQEELYSRVQAGDVHHFELEALNRRTIARSRDFATKEAMERALRWAMVNVPTYADEYGLSPDMVPGSRTRSESYRLSLALADREPEAQPPEPEAQAPEPVAQDLEPEEPEARNEDIMSTTRDLPPLPGLEVVGRGILLRPNQPFELKRRLFPHSGGSPCHIVETDETYTVPDGYAVNNSPPMPANQAHNQTVVDESWSQFESRNKLDVNVVASNRLFSIDATRSKGKHIRSREDAYYASRISFVPMWSVYIEDQDLFAEELLDLTEIPDGEFKHKYRRSYDRFFNRYGSHFVRRVWLGGAATITFTVAKSTSLSKTEIQQGLKASVGKLASGEVNQSAQESKDKLENQSQCVVYGKGGDELKLAELTSFDEDLYNQWLQSIPHNPQVIEIEVVGIWTLLNDAEKAQALQDAYKADSLFLPVNAIFEFDSTIYFIREIYFFSFHIEESSSTIPRKFAKGFLNQPSKSTFPFDRVDAALRCPYLRDTDGKSLDRKVFFFRKEQYVRFDFDKQAVDEGYPKPIAEGWPGVDFKHIDAAINADDEHIYFFSGDRYVRFSIADQRVEEGYPDVIANRWDGVTFDRIDSAIHWGNGKVYFFSGSEYIRYDMVLYRSDPGYPKGIIGSYVEDWKFFD